MPQQVYFEDVQEGMELPPLVRGPLDTPHIVRFSATVENYEKLHHDYLWCREHGFPHILVAGPLKQAFLASLVNRWMGEGGFLRRLNCSHRGIDLPGCVLTARGRVVRKWEEDGLGYVECEVWIENQQGQKTCPGGAVAVLPRKDGRPVPGEYEPPPEAYQWARLEELAL